MKIRQFVNKYQALQMASVFAWIFLFGVPAYAFPTPEAVWVVGGALLKPALILFPLALLLWRKLEWPLKWVHLRAFGNRRFASVFLVFLTLFLMDIVDRLTFYEEPPPVSKSGRPIAEGSQLTVDAFDGILREESESLQILDIRSRDAFNNWHIQGSINMPDATRKDIQAFFGESLARQNIIICYGGERSRSIARYLRTHFENTAIHSVFKGVFQLKLKLSDDAEYIVRNIPPVLANTWLEYDLAKHGSDSRLEVKVHESIFYPGVMPIEAPPAWVASIGAGLHRFFGGAWTAWTFLLSLNACVFFILIYRRKRSLVLSQPSWPGWVELCVVSLLTVAIAFVAMSFPEFFGTTAQEYPVFGENNFSRLLILYIVLVAVPLTWHLEHTGDRKERDFLERLVHVRSGIQKPWQRKVYLNVAPLLAFLVVVYFSVEVNCTGLWSLIFSLWATLLAEKAAEYGVLRKYGKAQPADSSVGETIAKHPAFQRAKQGWQALQLDEVVCDARELTATCSGTNGLTHSIFLERLYPGGSQDKGIRALGQRTREMGRPQIRLLRMGRELYRAVNPLLEGFHASRFELRLHNFVFPKLRQLWLRRGIYWLNRHLLPLIEKRLQQINKAQTPREQKRVLNRILEELEKDFAPFQETIVRLHSLESSPSTGDASALPEHWTQAMLRGRYVCEPEAKKNWAAMNWTELCLPQDESFGYDTVASLHIRASILVLCLHDMVGILVHALNASWGYGEYVYELNRREILAHGQKPWPGMKEALCNRTQRELPWNHLEPQRIVWPEDAALSLKDSGQHNPKPVVLAPASEPGSGPVHQGDLDKIVRGSVVVVDQLLASDLQKVREAKAIYCTRGSSLSHPILVAREWGLPVFKVDHQEKERLLEQATIVFESDGTWRKASA